MDPVDWQEGDIIRRKAPYKRTNVPCNELCRVKSVKPLTPGRTLIIAVGNRTTGSPSDRIGKYYDWVSRGDTL